MNLSNCTDHGARGDSRGYQRIYHADTRNTQLLHRLVYCQASGKTLSSIKGLVVRHKCDNPRCVNPEHLEIGTSADNSRDAVIRGRIAKGRKIPQAKLDTDTVHYLRQMHISGDRQWGACAIARRLGMAQSTISVMLKGATWH